MNKLKSYPPGGGGGGGGLVSPFPGTSILLLLGYLSLYHL